MKTALGGGCAIAALLWAGGAWAQEAAPTPEPPPPPPTISEAIGAGKLIFEARARFEDVDQTGTALRASAPTLRIKLGWETGEWHGARALVEMEDVRLVGAEHYNVAIPGPGGASLNGKTTFPIVNDPEVTELNRLQLTWSSGPAFSTTLGRQRILLDDQRFIGNVIWRQDEQTFDAARFDLAFGKFKATYVYVDRVNRILGESRDWMSESHLVNATWSISEPLRIQAFSYALDFANATANSTQTDGVRVSGKVWAGLYQVSYGATYARQRDYGLNPSAFSLDYTQAEIAGTYDIWTVRLNYEDLGGDGVRGFATPLGTTHLFNGWSDAFATAGGNKTHLDGIKDTNLSIVIQPRFRYTYWQNTQIIIRYHDFDASRTGAQLASEVDVQIQAAITPKLTFLIKYADFDRAETVPIGTTLAPVDRRKGWISLEYRF